MFTTTVLKKKKKNKRDLFTRISPRSFYFILFYFGEGRAKSEVFEVRAIWRDVSSSCEKSTCREKWPPSGGEWIEIWPKVGGFRPIVDAHAIEEHLVPRLNLRSLACTTTDKSLSFSNHFVFSSLCRLVGSFFLFVVSFSLLFMKVWKKFEKETINWRNFCRNVYR